MPPQLGYQIEATPTNGVPTTQQHAVAAPRSADGRGATVPMDSIRQRTHTRTRRLWRLWGGIAGVLALSITGLSWQLHRPQVVSIIRPTLLPVTESLATTGRVSGTREALVSAPVAGIVEKLFVHEGEWVTAGTPLAALKSEVATAQMAQAQAALHTVRAQLQQVSRVPLRSEVEAAAAHVHQARAQLHQQRIAVAHAEHAVAHVREQLSQSEAEQELAVRQYERSAQLATRGFIAQAAFDQAQANLRIAEAKVRSQQQALAMAQTNVRGAQTSVEATLANVQAQEARLQTVQTGARPEDIQVVRLRVEEAEHALRVARQQVANAVVAAPFAGLVTAINTEVGQTVGAQGVLKLVSRDTEIRVDVDESNMADLAVGQDVILSSNTFRNSSFHGTTTKITASVDEARGTVTVTIVPIVPPAWLRPGQTVNVNIITHPTIQRLLVPDSAIVRVGSSSGVLIVEDGQARPKTVITRPPTAQGVPVLTGLTGHERVIINPQGIAAGDTVRVREGTS